jgi:hypothetical protein
MHLAPEQLAVGQAGHQLRPAREANMSTEPFFEKDGMCRPHPYRISRRFFSAWRVGGLQRGGKKYPSFLAIADASADASLFVTP